MLLINPRFVLVAFLLISASICVPTWAELPKPEKQYKRVHQAALTKILDGKIAETIADLKQLTEQYPDDAENYYLLAVAHAEAAEIEQAVAAAEKAIAAGLPPERFICGTRTGLRSLRKHEFGQSLYLEYAHEAVQGPMVGCVSGDSARVWVRTAKAANVIVLYGTDANLNNAQRSQPVASSRSTDFTVEVPIADLRADTRYHFALEIDGERSQLATSSGSFRTTQPDDKPAKFRLAFGGGAGYVPHNERMWTTIANENPDYMLLLGDNVYSDDPQTPQMQHYCYYRRQSRTEYRSLLAKVPVFSIWDDHDFGTNDCQGGPEIEKPKWKRSVFEVYRNNWVNPAYGGGDEHPGVYYDFYLGDVHFVMLDGRYYRNLKPGTVGHPSMLGPVQLNWLREKIRDSRGRLLVLCSPVPWTYVAKGDSKDTWNGFKEERTQIFDFLAEQKREGVVLVSADRHRSDLWKIERPNGYTLYECNSSRLTNQHVHKTMKEAVFSYNAKQSFGTLDFDTTAADPTVTYRVVTIDGEEMHSHTIQRSELK